MTPLLSLDGKTITISSEDYLQFLWDGAGYLLTLQDIEKDLDLNSEIMDEEIARLSNEASRLENILELIRKQN